MTEIAILTATGLAMFSVWIVTKAGHKQELEETADREFMAGYQTAIIGKEQIDPLARIIRTATAVTKGKTQ